MKWALLLLLISCGAKNSSTTKPNTTQINQESTQPKVCLPGALPAEHVRSEDYLSFANFSFQGIGRCRGHAILTQRLLMLMRFKPSAPANFDCDSEPATCRIKVRALLDQVDNSKVVAVPGFDSLADFPDLRLVR